MNENLKPAIIAAVQNAERLLDDARNLLDMERYPTACALSILAQEEFAKGFLLHLIQAGAFPWNDDVRGALRDHKCKQLLGLLMQYVSPEFEELMEEYKSPNPIRLPRKIADAMNIIRHEKLSNSTWQWLEDGDPPCDPVARKIGDGKLDAQKQRCLYVGIGKTGRVTTSPSTVTPAQAQTEFENADRLRHAFTDGDISNESLRYEMVLETFKALFGTVTVDEYNAHWWA